MSTDRHTDPPQRLVTVVIPLYTLRLNANELLSLRQCFTVLAHHDIAIVKPKSLDVSPLGEMLGMKARYRVEAFDDRFFAGRAGYNCLMLSAEFYDRFADSQYVLIHQTDVYVFRDDLEAWCRRGYDYVGAPWLPAAADVSGANIPRRLFYALRRTYSRLMPGFHPVNLKYQVGNGGCSLRHTRHLREAIDLLPDLFAQAAEGSERNENFEDVVWSVRVNQARHGTLNVAPCREAARFSMESHPEMAMRFTEGKLPMAVHAFARKRNRRFWRQYIPIANP